METKKKSAVPIKLKTAMLIVGMFHNGRKSKLYEFSLVGYDVRFHLLYLKEAQAEVAKLKSKKANKQRIEKLHQFSSYVSAKGDLFGINTYIGKESKEFYIIHNSEAGKEFLSKIIH